MKRTFSFDGPSALVLSGTALVAVTYGLVRLAYGLFLPDVQAELGLDDATAGLISSAASALYCLGALAGFLLAATRPRLLVVLAAVTAGGGAAGTALGGDVATFGVAAVVSSAGAGLASPALVALVRRGVDAAGEGRAQAVVNSGTGPGLALAGLLALLLLPEWRTAWAVAAVAAGVAAAAVLLSDRRTAPRAAGQGRQESRPARARQALPPRTWFAQHGTVVLAAGLLGAGSAAVWTYGRTLLVASGATPTVSVVAWIALGLGGASVAATARWTSRLRPGAAWAVTVGAVAVATLSLAAAPQASVLALAACVVFGWGYTAATGALIAWTTDLDPGRAAPGTSMLFVVLVLGQALGAAGAGALVGTVGLPVTFAVAAAVTAAGVAVTVPRSRRARA